MTLQSSVMFIALLALLCSFRAAAQVTTAAIGFKNNTIQVKGQLTADDPSKDGIEVSLTITGLDASVKYSYHIHNLAVVDRDCNKTGDHYDPHNANTPASPSYKCKPDKAKDTCEGGDLSGKFGAVQNRTMVSLCYKDPLIKLSDVIGRSIVLHGANKARVACGNILLRRSPASKKALAPVTAP
ncbi:hypothetical protein SpCBS45565_g04029 [Spizellomyces sp. 'palustris']|nr:hypothetical protein SpCBS45565_g04029 [Spizellomyces sp. 'palustris']